MPTPRWAATGAAPRRDRPTAARRPQRRWAEPERVTPDTPDSLTVEVTVRNDDTETIDTQLPSSTMLVDGKPLLSWNNAIGNGARDVRASALPPGETVRAKRVLGPALVREPGEHEAVL